MTPHERYQRGIDLAGEIKQADALCEECERAEAEALRAYETAKMATLRQQEVRVLKYQEASKLALESYDHFMAMVPGESAAPDVTPCPNGESRLADSNSE